MTTMKQADPSKRVRGYVSAHPEASPEQVARALRMPVATVAMHWPKEVDGSPPTGRNNPMRRVLGTSPERALADMFGPPPPPGVPSARWYAGRNISGATVAWRRGHQAGVHDAIMTLEQKYPKQAAELRAAFGMEPDGSIVLGKVHR